MQYCPCWLPRLPLPLNQCSLRIRFTKCSVHPAFYVYRSLAHSLQFSSSISITCETPLRLKCEIAMWKSWSWRWRTTFIYKPVINIVSALKNRNCGIMVHFWHATLLAYRIHVYSVCLIEPCINNNITHTHTHTAHTAHSISGQSIVKMCKGDRGLWQSKWTW